MGLKKYICILIALIVYSHSYSQTKSSGHKAYYVSSTGNDSNPGNQSAPFKTIDRLNRLILKPGDAVYFKGREEFKGTLIVKTGSAGGKLLPVIISSYGKGKAILNADSARGISIYNTAYITIKNLKLIGLGRKTGNHESGLAIIGSSHITAENLNISGFQKPGLLIDSSSKILCSNVFAHDNGSAGISVEGRSSKKDSRDIHIINCRAENNPGDPTKLDNHSGNGIVVGYCTNVLIEHCTASNNGWDMPRIGNGPVGIWCYEADSVTIQYCLAYKNKTSKGAADGGGFDFDGGTTNSVIQYCFSYGNQGSGYCMFQYWGASAWYNNVIRYNISENDGTVSDSQAGIYIWNSSDDSKQFYNCRVYGNIIYNDKVAAISFSDKSESKGFKFTNNIFVAKDSLIKGKDLLGNCMFKGNDWWSIQSGFNMHGIRNLKTWAGKTGKEMENNKLFGLNIRPNFKQPGKTVITSDKEMKGFEGYKLIGKSRLDGISKSNILFN